LGGGRFSVVVEALLRKEGMGVSEKALLGRARGYLLRIGVLAAFMLLMTLLYASTAWADTITVTNLNDSGPGSLREAMEAAEANAGADEIVFADGVGGTITLASTLPVVRDPAGLVIDGGGDVTVSGNNAVTVFFVGRNADQQGGALSLRNLKITDGKCTHILCGGAAIFTNGESLEVINTTISGNDAARGVGGAIASVSDGPLTITNSTISDNSAGAGGGIYDAGGGLTVTNSTISGNSASFWGGGILSESPLMVTNSTISGNSASRRGGGIASTWFGDGLVTNSTISGNSASGSGGGIFNDDGNFMTLRNTIVANSTSSGNCGGQGPITDLGYNIDDGRTCGFTQATGSLPNTNPLLNPDGLADNGGPTQTIALLPQSPAVDLVGQEACPPPNTDQRGVERPQGEACDSGAFELVQGPQTKADCKQGGWEEFGFKNQGRCIASLQREQVQTSQ
jgi:hypothetical protein